MAKYMGQASEGMASRLRERAAHCRELARGGLPQAVVRELLAIATDYEEDADTLAGGKHVAQ